MTIVREAFAFLRYFKENIMNTDQTIGIDMVKISDCKKFDFRCHGQRVCIVVSFFVVHCVLALGSGSGDVLTQEPHGRVFVARECSDEVDQEAGIVSFEKHVPLESANIPANGVVRLGTFSIESKEFASSKDMPLNDISNATLADIFAVTAIENGTNTALPGKVFTLTTRDHASLDLRSAEFIDEERLGKSWESHILFWQPDTDLVEDRVVDINLEIDEAAVRECPIHNFQTTSDISYSVTIGPKDTRLPQAPVLENPRGRWTDAEQWRECCQVSSRSEDTCTDDSCLACWTKQFADGTVADLSIGQYAEDADVQQAGFVIGDQFVHKILFDSSESDELDYISTEIATLGTEDDDKGRLVELPNRGSIAIDFLDDGEDICYQIQSIHIPSRTILKSEVACAQPPKTKYSISGNDLSDADLTCVPNTLHDLRLKADADTASADFSNLFADDLVVVADDEVERYYDIARDLREDETNAEQITTAKVFAASPAADSIDVDGFEAPSPDEAGDEATDEEDGCQLADNAASPLCFAFFCILLLNTRRRVGASVA